MDLAPEPATRTPPADLALRAARPADAEAIAALMSLPGFLWGTAQLPFVSPERVRPHLEKEAGDDRTIVALAGGILVGHATLERERARRSHAGRIGIGVHDDWVGRGIGRALMAALVELADDWLGLRRLELTVVTDNAAAPALSTAASASPPRARIADGSFAAENWSTCTRWRGCGRLRRKRLLATSRSTREDQGSALDPPRDGRPLDPPCLRNLF